MWMMDLVTNSYTSLQEYLVESSDHVGAGPVAPHLVYWLVLATVGKNQPIGFIQYRFHHLLCI